MKKSIVLTILLNLICALLIISQDVNVEFEGGLQIGNTIQEDGIIRFKGNNLEIKVVDGWTPLSEGVPLDSVINNKNGTYSLYFVNGSIFTTHDLGTKKGETMTHDSMSGPDGSQSDNLWLAEDSNIYYSSGNVGIGTKTPEKKLQILGKAIIGNSPTAFTELGFRGSNGFINATGDGNLDFRKNNTTLMSLSSNGKFQIGNLDTPGNYNLYVENGILTEEVKVAIKSTADWSDDAFQQIPDLDDVRKSITEKSHLLEMPSANELVTTGYSVTEMDANILKQVEWLWVHLLNLKEENDELKKEVVQLQQMEEDK